MQRRTVLVTLLAGAMLALPAGAADWTGRGFYEPDTERDRLGGFMFADPDTNPNAAVRKVYFSAFGAYYVLTPNHNVGTLGSQVLPYPTNMHAVLGVWKDCNDDGYIGLMEGLFAEYRAELLADTTICPATPTPDHADPAFKPVHNDGAWVREFLVIGPDFIGQEPSADNNTNHFNIADESARIWGDWGLPEDDTKASCPVNPRPEGTYQSTGGFLRYSDCFTNWRITGTINQVAHATGQHGLAFDDAEYYRPDKSQSPLNQPNPWGQERDDAYAEAFDCSKPIVVHDDTGLTHQRVTDPRDGEDIAFVNLTDENHDRFVAGTPQAPTPNTGGSAAGTVNSTTEGVGAFGTSNCNRTDDNGGWTAGQIYELDEAPFEGTTTKRTSTDVWYFFTEGTGAGTFLGGDGPICVEDASGNDVCHDAPWRGWPRDLGQSVSQSTLAANSVGTWFGTPGYAVSRNPYVNRDDLTPWGGVYYSAYAKVDTGLGLQVAAGTATGTYGSPHCDGTVETTGAFNCDPAKWWLSPDGSSLQNDWQVVPGATYNLLDIDCYDASPFRGSPVHTGHLGRECVR